MMPILDQVTLPGDLQTVAVSPSGARVAVVVGSAEWSKPPSPPPDQVLHVYSMPNGRLAEERSIPLADLWDAEEDADERRRCECSRVAFMDENTAFVARLLRHGWDECIEVVGVDLRTGQQHSRRLSLPYPRLVCGVAAVPPGHLLAGAANTVVCLDAGSLAETCRAWDVSEDGDPEEEDALPEEAMMPGGFTFDAGGRLLYTLTGCFEIGVLACYRLLPGCTRFERQWRRDVLATRPAPAADLPAAGGIAMGLHGSGVLAAFKLDDLRLDLWGRPMGDRGRARDEALALGAGRSIPLPVTSRIGWLAVLGLESDTWVEVLSDAERDLQWDTDYEPGADGEAAAIGYKACSTDPWVPMPVAVDDRQVAIASPTGLVQVVDVSTGTAHLHHDAGGPVTCLAWWAGPRCLLVGRADRTLTVLAPDEAGVLGPRRE